MSSPDKYVELSPESIAAPCGIFWGGTAHPYVMRIHEMLRLHSK